MSEKNKRNQKKSGLGLAVWVLAFLIILIIFLVKQEEIKTNLKDTRFFERLFGKTPTFITNAESKNKDDELSSETIIEIKKDKSEERKKEKIVSDNQKNTEDLNKKNQMNEKLKIKETLSKNQITSEDKKKEGTVSGKSEINTNEKTALKTQTKVSSLKTQVTESENSVEKKINEDKTLQTAKQQTTVPQTLSHKICFVALDSEGPIIRKEVSRNVAKDSPLTNSIKSLLQGPSASEKSKGCMSLIPEGTQLYSAMVKDGTAYLNFNENFEFQQIGGIEGQLGKLMQVVYTATDYSSVNSVQILIEGKKKEYLGSEGVWIGSPLRRASFN